MSSTPTAPQDDERDLSTAVPTPRPPSELVESKDGSNQDYKEPSKSESKEPTIAEPEPTSEKAPTGVGPSKTEEGEAPPADNKRYLTGIKLFLVFVGFLLSVFLIALDQTIVATAQPKIVSQFNALEKIAWVSSAYFLTNAGLILTAGQIMTVCPTKYVYLAAIGIFELGSLFCAVAPSMDFLIFGRAVAGTGAAGIFTSILAIVAEVTRLEDRPVLFGSFGGVFALASATGPLLGGAFTDHVSWRWCFYINLPFGALAITSVVLFLHTEGGIQREDMKSLTTWQKIMVIDYLGTALALAFVTSLLLALQWGGNSKPWNDKDVVATLTLSGVLLICFAVWEWYRGPGAMLPLQLLTRRTQVGCAAEAFFIFLCMLIGTYYLPLWYQAKGASASQSGVDILAFMLSLVAAASISGLIINKTGRYWPWIVGSPLLAAVAAGLLFTITPETPNSRVIGFQFLFGFGLGGALQNVVIAVQTEYAREEHLIPQGTSVVNFVQIVGGVIGITVGAAVFANQLASALTTFAPNLDPLQVVSVRSSVTAIFTLPPDLQQGVIQAYSHALDRVFVMGVPAAALASISALIVNNYNIKTRSPTAGLGGMAA